MCKIFCALNINLCLLKKLDDSKITRTQHVKDVKRAEQQEEKRECGKFLGLPG
jgi:hypothetical protein